MNHLEAVKKWPAAYSIMAVVMDDISISPEKAREKWGAKVCSLAESCSTEAIDQTTVIDLLDCLAEKLHCNFKSRAEAPTGTGKASSPAPSSPPPVRAVHSHDGARNARGHGGARGPRRPAVKAVKRGIVTERRDEDKEARFGGGTRPVMLVVPDGEKHSVKGTVPAAVVSTLKVGDAVEFEAEFTIFPDRQGWFRYPKNLKVVS